MSYTLHHGDCLDAISAMPDAIYDAIITDPPYPGIKREYGYWEPDAWLAMMRVLVPELRRVLKPSGSCVMVLQPNSERVGRMRTWLWEFMAWVGKEWGIVQDAYWWNTTTMPTVHTQRLNGLMRNSVKPCLWLGEPRCYRNQDAILWGQGEWHALGKAEHRATRIQYPSGHSYNPLTMLDVARDRGGVTPYNLIPISNNTGNDDKGGHGAGTPLELCRWWTRYICPPGGAILDPFAGSATTGIAAIEHGCDYTGIERYAKYWSIAEARLAETAAKYASQQLRMAV